MFALARAAWLNERHGLICAVLSSSRLRYVVIEELDYLRDVAIPQQVHSLLMLQNAVVKIPGGAHVRTSSRFFAQQYIPRGLILAPSNPRMNTAPILALSIQARVLTSSHRLL